LVILLNMKKHKNRKADGVALLLPLGVTFTRNTTWQQRGKK